MKKNKTVAFMLAATLLVGGTFMGTKAWFTDTKEVDNTLTVTMGAFDLELTENGATDGSKAGWTLVREGEVESTNPDANGIISQYHTAIRPGDKFTRTYTIINKGDLDQILSIGGTLPTEVKEGLCELKIEGPNGELVDGMILNPFDPKTFTLTVTPNAEELNKKEHAGKSLDLSKLNLDVIKIDAKQINDPASNPQ